MRCGFGIFAALASSAYVMVWFARWAVAKAISVRRCHELLASFLSDICSFDPTFVGALNGAFAEHCNGASLAGW